MTPEFLDTEYARVVAERYMRGVEYWRERFALLAAQPVRKVRVFSPDPVEPRPASLEPRYVGKTSKVRVTPEQRAEQKRQYERRKREEANAAKGPALCMDCKAETHYRAKRCKPCAYKHKLAISKVRSQKKYQGKHGFTGYRHAVATLDVPRIIGEVIQKRTAAGRSVYITAAEIGIAHSSLFCFERGEQLPGMNIVRKLCAWLGVEPEAFLRSAA